MERSGYERLAAAVEGCVQPVFYLGTPPSLFATVVRGLAEVGLAARGRVVVEKPFGRDLSSARTLSAELHQYLDERQIYRIDHFLGKPPVEDIVILRFWNTLLEPVWNRHYIDHIQITMAESAGVGVRGDFYDPVGALRDVVQNHLLNVLAIVAMEPPSGRDPDSFRNHVVDVLLAMAPAEPAEYVRGQYGGYVYVDGVAPDSRTETYAALRLQVDNWRWAGVPFLLRTGKALAARATEVHVVFQLPPPLRFTGRLAEPPQPNELVLRIDPAPGSRLILQSRAPERRRLRTVRFDMPFAQDAQELRDPYEALLAAVLMGNQRPFVREDAIEESWRVLQPLLDAAPPLHTYAPGSWGPGDAERLAASSGGWRDPWLG
jgi:glucose-6-phosphate 1-dehydrogenase